MTISRFADPGAQSPGFLLWKVTQRWQRAVTAALAPLGLTHAQFVMLACTHWLNREHGPVPQIDVARQAGVDPQMVSEVLRRVERAGLITRSPDPNDARAKRVALTPAGQRVVIEAIAVVEAADADFFAAAEPGVVTGLRSLLG